MELTETSPEQPTQSNPYSRIATIIRGNPDMTLAEIKAEYRWSLYTMKMAMKQNDIKRPRGRKAAA